jgi:aryl-alcohol dehydrogenase-like predicted oxidoreductase
VGALINYAQEIEVPLLTLAFSWLLSHPEVKSVIAGASNADQVLANAEAAKKLSTEQIAALNVLTD